jgi:hypothetical protein
MSEFDAMLDAAELGDNAGVDLTVGDIYGGDYARMGLKASTIASSFGKAISLPSIATHGGSSGGGGGGGGGGGLGSGGGGGGGGGGSFPSSSAAASAAAGSGADGAGLGYEQDGSYRAIRGPGPRRSAAKSFGGSSSSSGWPHSPQHVGSAGPSAGAVVPLALLAAEAQLPPDFTAAAAPPPESVPASPTRAAVAPAAAAETPSGAGAGAGGSGGGARRYEPADVSRALLIMISNNIGQLAYLNALQHRCADVYFAGNFLRHENTVAMRTLAYSVRFWSKGKMDGLFLRHEGYCGALGAFLTTLEMAAEAQRAGSEA